MEMKDTGHDLTERQLAALERRIASVYKEAAGELQETIDAYFESFTKRDEEMKALIGTVVNGREYTEQDYIQWRLAQIGRGERFKALRDKIAQRYTDAKETAVAYCNDTTPSIYSLNRNYAAYTIEQQVGADVGFNLWDEQTVKRLIVGQPELMPYYPPERALKRGIDLAYGKKQITACVTSSILQGKSVKGIADDLQSRIPAMNRNSAIRTARTAVTGAQNAGRYDTYRAARDMGIDLVAQWLATLDNRTRHSHAVLDGQQREIDDPFEVDGQKILYPGYTLAVGSLIYNCRCTLIGKVRGVDTSDAKRRAVDPVTGESELIEDMSYPQWYAMKERQHGKKVMELARKKAANKASDKKQFEAYKSLLGKDAPKSFAKFQDLKYNEPEKWATLKTLKRQTAFVNNASCVTTPKKFSGYFLKSGAKHADQFFDVGYTQDNPLQLRYDMALQFDMDKATHFSINEKGEEKFRIYMQLGVTEKKTFRTAWQKDTPDSEPRILTAFREDVKNDK